MQPKSLGLGFELSNSSIQPLEKTLEEDQIQEAIAQDKPILSKKDNGHSSLAIPIRLRGQIIGVINLRTRNSYSLSQDDADVADSSI